MQKNHWEEIYKQGLQLNKYPFDAVVSLVLRMKKHNDNLKVLELGSGGGNNIVFMASEGVTAAGIDISPSAIAFTQKRLSEINKEADMIIGSFTQLPWENDSFDLVIDRGALTCAPKPDVKVALGEVARVLKSGGVFYSQIMASEHPANVTAANQGEEFTSGFADGYFPGVDGLFFANKMDIQTLFADFNQVDISKNISTNLNEDIVHAQWTVNALNK